MRLVSPDTTTLCGGLMVRSVMRFMVLLSLLLWALVKWLMLRVSKLFPVTFIERPWCRW